MPNDTVKVDGAAMVRAAGLAMFGEADETTPFRIVSSKKDYKANGGCREHWFRLVWRSEGAADPDWQYLGERLGPVGLRAASRYGVEYADVWPGELVIEHHRGRPIHAAYLVVGAGGDLPAALLELEIGSTRAGDLRIELPDGQVTVRPNPRRGPSTGRTR